MERLWPTDRGDWRVLFVFSGFPLGLGHSSSRFQANITFRASSVSIRHLSIDEWEVIKGAIVIKAPNTKNRPGEAPDDGSIEFKSFRPLAGLGVEL